MRWKLLEGLRGGVTYEKDKRIALAGGLKIGRVEARRPVRRPWETSMQETLGAQPRC
jgi:hypothetical protein